MPIGWIKINFTEDSCNVKGGNRIDVSAQTPPTYEILSAPLNGFLPQE